MEATMREARLGDVANFAEEDGMTSVRYAGNNMLSELPGIVFGLITLAYIVSSLVALL